MASLREETLFPGEGDGGFVIGEKGSKLKEIGISTIPIHVRKDRGRTLNAQLIYPLLRCDGDEMIFIALLGYDRVNGFMRES